MRQEHPLFSQPQIFFGSPIHDDGMDEDEEEQILANLWSIPLGEMQHKTDDKIGLIFFWSDPLSADKIHFS